MLHQARKPEAISKLMWKNIRVKKLQGRKRSVEGLSLKLSTEAEEFTKKHASVFRGFRSGGENFQTSEDHET